MGEHQTTLRIHGASSANEVLQAVLSGLPPTTRVSLDHGFLRIDDAWGIDGLHMRHDGVVELHVWDSSSVGTLPAAWLVYSETSYSRGIDYHSIDITRGAEVLLSLMEGPDGDLAAQVGEEVIEEIGRRWRENGERLPAEGDEITWPAFRERHLRRVAPALGEAAVVLSDEDTALPPSSERQGLDDSAPPEGDDIPF